MLHKHRYFDKHGNEVAAHEALRGGKVLRDGFSMVTPTTLRDSSRFNWDAHRAASVVTGTEGNRPGFRVLDNNSGRQAIADAHAAYVKDLESAWRTPLVGDARKKEDPPVTGRSRCPECDGKGVVHGKYCQGCGGDGWVDDDENNDDEDEDDNGNGKRRVEMGADDLRTVDVRAIAANHRVKMQTLYDAHARELSEAWRKR